MHGFDSRQEDASTAKRFEAQHRSDDALDEPVILFGSAVGNLPTYAGEHDFNLGSAGA